MKYLKRIGDFLGSMTVFRNTLVLSLVSVACGELAYAAAWKTAERVLRPQQTVSADDAMEKWFSASLAEVKRKRKSHNERGQLPTAEVPSVSRR